MNAADRQRISAELDAHHAYPPQQDMPDGRPFALDDEDGAPVALTPEQEDWAALFSPPLTPTHEVVAIVSAPASLAARASTVRELADRYAAVSEACGAVGRDGNRDQRLAVHARVAEARQRLHDAIDALARITPADRARAEGR